MIQQIPLVDLMLLGLISYTHLRIPHPFQASRIFFHLQDLQGSPEVSIRKCHGFPKLAVLEVPTLRNRNFGVPFVKRDKGSLIASLNAHMNMPKSLKKFTTDSATTED